MVTEVASVILRFRDLNVPNGRTIALHHELIESRGSVWWGWWAQLNERIADEAMSRLMDLADVGLEMYLADSGRKALYRVHCVAIKWDFAKKTVLSPEPDATPQYYIERPCLAWFQFDHIEEIDADAVADTIRALSYVSVPELFADRDEPYSAFGGKQVSSLEELFLQRRTLWFVRPNRAGDPIHEIRLLGADSQEPRDFAETFLESRGNRFLWLSDLHFSAAGHHAFPLEPTPAGDSVPLAEALIRALGDLDVGELVGIVVSGDVTWRADPAEYGLAEEMLRQVMSAANVKNVNQRLAIAPGNHDIKFSESPDDAGAEVTIAPEEAKQNFGDFYRRLFRRHPNGFLSSGRKFLVGRSIPVELVVLNSSILDQIPQPADGHPFRRFQGQGFLGETQLRDAAEQMKWDGRPRPGRVIRIVVLHHHLMPVAHSEPARLGGNYSVVLDSGRLVDWIVKHRVDVVLHGHQHEPFLARVGRPVTDADATDWHEFYVVGMGSTGVAGEHLPPDVTNVFSVLEFEHDAVLVSVYSIDPVAASKPVWSRRLPIQ